MSRHEVKLSQIIHNDIIKIYRLIHIIAHDRLPRTDKHGVVLKILYVTGRWVLNRLKNFLARIDSPMPMHLNQIVSIWRGRDPQLFRDHVELYQKIAERVLKLGEPLLACDMIREALTCSTSPIFYKLQAKALTQCGAYHSALEITRELMESGSRDMEMLVLCGRLHKLVAREMPDVAQAANFLRKAMRFYSMAYAEAKQAHSVDMANHAGINLAALSLVMGDEKSAFRFVNEVIRGNQEAALDRNLKNFWVYASLAEAHLIIRNTDQALVLYQKAVAAAHEELHSIVSMRRQAQVILEHYGYDATPFDEVFAIPSVASMTGLMIDHPASEIVRFPQRIVSRVRRQIVTQIIKHNIGIGFCSGASGSDLIFAEEMIKRNNEVNIVLPFNADRYRQTIQEISGDPYWVEVFDQVLGQASTIITLADEMGTDDQAPFLYCNEIIEGMASLRAGALNANLIHIAVWDESDAPDIRGTSGSVRRWLTTGQTGQVISTRALLKSTPKAKDAEKSDESEPASTEIILKKEPAHQQINVRNQQVLRSIMFADTVGYSKITDREIPLYVEHFMSMVPDIIKQLGLGDVYRRTWRDAVFMVFDSLDAAAEFSLTLCDSISRVDWSRKGLPSKINFRISLHAGPVYMMNDPVTDQMNYYGYHISKGARIEPITPPGQVYTSEHFAALMAARGIKQYVCDYVGRVPHAKDFGTFPLYHLKRRSIG